MEYPPMVVDKGKEGKTLKPHSAKSPKTWEPREWLPYHNVVLKYYLEGMPKKKIAKKVHKSPVQISRIINSEMFQQQLWGSTAKTIQKHNSEKIDTFQKKLDTHKDELFQLALDMILGYKAESESVRASLLKWMLERYPEFVSEKDKVQIGINQQTHVRQEVSPEQLETQKEVAKDLKEAKKLLLDGNKYVLGEQEDVRENVLQNDRPHTNNPQR